MPAKSFQTFLTIILISTAAFAGDGTKRDYASNVTIVRDEWGVPHIFGKTNADVAYGLAWAHSEDDFITIQETFIGAKAMMGKLKGKEGAIIDFFQHAIGTEKRIHDLFKTFSDDFVAYIEGYTQGLNDFASANPQEVLLKKAFPLDVKDIARAYFISLAFNSDVHREIKKILDGDYDTVKKKIKGAKEDDDITGSNAFAFNAKMTADGKTYLCVNPHQPMEGHFSWYEAHLVSEEGMNILGALFPGGSSIYVGTTPNLGWTHTSNELDAVDVYRLEMHPVKKLMYKFDDEWLPLEEREIVLDVKVKKWLFNIPVKKTTYWSVHGPVLRSKNGEFYALRYPSAMEIRAPEQWYRMNNASNFEEFMTAVKMNTMPKYTITYADKEDNIFFIDNGMFPQRDSCFDWKGTLTGITSKTLWKTCHPVDFLPQLHNPECGYVFNMNNTPYDATCEHSDIYPGHPENMGLCSFNTNRSLRFMELMNEYPVVSFEDMKRIKYDTSFPDSSVFLSSIQNLFNLDEEKYPHVKEMLRVVKTFDKKTHGGCTASGAFLVVFEYLLRERKLGNKIFGEGMYVEDEEYVEALEHTQNYLMKHFGKIEVPLSEIQRIRRGKVDLPMPGYPDVLAAAYGKPAKDGRFVGWIGDSYTMFVSYDENGVTRIETLHPFGSSADPESPHYTDQMQLYVKQTPKKMTLEKAEILRNAKKIYHPNGKPVNPEADVKL